jgi:hypothetical protein
MLGLLYYQAAGIYPVFVFGGLHGGGPRRQRNAEAEAEQEELIREGWAHARAQRMNSCLHSLGRADDYLGHDKQDALLAALRCHRRAGLGGPPVVPVGEGKGKGKGKGASPATPPLEAFRAPCSAAAQLAYFNRAGPRRPAPAAVPVVHACYGGLELLLHGCRTVVLDLDFKAQTVRYVQLEETLRVLGLDFPQFVDMCLLAGYGRVRSFPAVHNEQGHFRFQLARELINSYGTAEQVAMPSSLPCPALPCPALPCPALPCPTTRGRSAMN